MTRTTARIAIALAVMFALTAGTGLAVADGGKKSASECQKYKYKVLHKPPGNPSNSHVISVGSWSAVEAHLAHGDKFLGKKCVKKKEKKKKEKKKKEKKKKEKKKKH